MREQLKQALIKETERHITQDILYDDVYVGPFTEKDGVDCAIHAADWYRNNVWHPISEKPGIGRITVCDKTNNIQTMNIIKPISNAHWMMIIYDRPHNINKWAYAADLLPDTKGGDS